MNVYELLTTGNIALYRHFGGCERRITNKGFGRHLRPPLENQAPKNLTKTNVEHLPYHTIVNVCMYVQRARPYIPCKAFSVRHPLRIFCRTLHRTIHGEPLPLYNVHSYASHAMPSLCHNHIRRRHHSPIDLCAQPNSFYFLLNIMYVCKLRAGFASTPYTYTYYTNSPREKVARLDLLPSTYECWAERNVTMQVYTRTALVLNKYMNVCA